MVNGRTRNKRNGQILLVSFYFYKMWAMLNSETIVHVICKLHLNIKFGTHKKFALWGPQRKHNLEVGMQRFLTLWIPVSQFILSSGTRLPHGSLSSGDKIPHDILSPPRIFCPQGQNTMATVSCPRGKDTIAVVSFPPSCFGYFCLSVPIFSVLLYFLLSTG